MAGRWIVAVIAAACAASGCAAQHSAASGSAGQRGNVIFVHPDGASAATWAAGRAYLVGPDNDLQWDLLPAVAVYRGHMADSLTATSNGGATTHAFGLKVASDAFGRTAGGDRGRDIVDEHGRSRSVAMQALRAGLSLGLVQSGISTEPGTACFVAFTDSRRSHDDIAAQLIECGASVILGGGERFFLPAGERGVHGIGVREDGRNLIAEAQQRGFTVVRTRDELRSLSSDTTRVLGLFAHSHTFNARTEEVLAGADTPLYETDAPTVAEMTDAALRVLAAGGNRFLLVVEEEGTDNFGNHNNASGMMEAMRRADEAIGVARRFVHEHPDTLVLTTADSDAGGMRMVGLVVDESDELPETLPAVARNGAPIDGARGTGTEPFIAAPDRTGQRLPFAISWANYDDVSGGALVRAEGRNSHLVRGSMDNTEIARIIRQTLFGADSPDQ